MEIVYLVVDIVTLYAIILFCEVVYEKNSDYHKKQRNTLSLGYLTLNYFLLTVELSAILRSVLQMLLVNMVMLSYKGKIKIKLSYSILFICFMVISEFISAYVIAIFFHLEIGALSENNIALCAIVACSLEFIIMMLVHLKKISLKQEKKENTLLFLIMPLASIFVIFSIHTFATNPFDISYELAILSICILALTNVYFYFLISKVQESVFSKHEINILKTQMNYYEQRQNTLDENYQQIRAIKHDLTHHFIYLKEQARILTQDELIREISSFIAEIQPIEQISYCQNHSLNGILNYKLYEAMIKKIPLDVKISVQKDTIVDVKILCIILGNLLDNAMENFDNKNAVEKSLVLRIVEESCNLYLQISNPYSKTIKYKNGIPITSKQDSTNHGIGLQNVIKLTKSNEGTIMFTITDCDFMAEVVLYNGAKNTHQSM